MNTERTARIKAAASPHWHSILTALGAPAEYLDGQHHPCPACGGRDRFRYDGHDKGSGSYICNQCGAGDGFSLIQKIHRCDFPTALKMVAGWLGNGFDSSAIPAQAAVVPARNSDPNMARYEKIIKLWNEALPVTSSDPAGKYLANRGITLASLPAALRFHPEVWTHINDELLSFPCLLAAFSDPSGAIVQVQRTFLTLDGHKAFADCKKLMPQWKPGAMRGGAIRLFDAGDTLGVAEGLETALAAHLLYGGMPVWACYSAKLLEQFEPPASIQSVLIFADHDANDTGKNAADRLRQQLTARGLEVMILMPAQVGTDFNDVLLSLINEKAA
jgi:putative DNA primase/helicase